MAISKSLLQSPELGTHTVMFKGDVITFTLKLPLTEAKGRAWIRTNIGNSAIYRNEIIRNAVYDEPILEEDWFDIPMTRIDNTSFKISLPLCDLGHFEAKCFFLPQGKSDPIWPEGSNTVINVEPAFTCCGNIIYNAFIRQFGPNKIGSGIPGSHEEEASYIKKLDQAGYTVIPLSGTFRDFIKELDFIIGELGCRIIHLLPINPTPTTYARMGRFGSPYASLSFTAVDPSLSKFDPKATPLEQFLELVDEIHKRNALIFLDIAINHTGWGASIHEKYPQWLVRDQEGKIEVPGAWGVLWNDLTKLDYTHKDLWQYMADVFLLWCSRGVDGFRCDAGYMIPLPAWRYIISAVRQQYPDTIFFLEGLGGGIHATENLLNIANFNWAYSELFQNYSRDQLEYYLPGAINISDKFGQLIHFAETHDNHRMAARSKRFSKMRVALCALSSLQGGFGFANGVEWFATNNIDVHGAPSLNWGAAVNQVGWIKRLNSILKSHPCFFDKTLLKMIQKKGSSHIVILRHHIPSGKRLIVIVNLDDENFGHASWHHKETEIDTFLFLDLLSGKQIQVEESEDLCSYQLEPGQVLCLTPDNNDFNLINKGENLGFLNPERAEHQVMKAKALDIFCFYNGICDVGNFDIEEFAYKFRDNPIEFCRSMNPESQESRVIVWKWPVDQKREVMIPPGHCLMVISEIPFRARLVKNGEKDNINIRSEKSYKDSKGLFFAFFTPIQTPLTHEKYMLFLSVYDPDNTKHVQTPLLFLSHYRNASVQRIFTRMDVSKTPLLMLGTNSRGGMLRANVTLPDLLSKYDALLAANLSPKYPEDRHIMFARCRAWINFQGYSYEICKDCFDSFCFDYRSRGFWKYNVPTGQGQHICLTIGFEMVNDQNSIRILFFRHPAGSKKGGLADHKSVQLIIRPDIEDRNFHYNTKAYHGLESKWANALEVISNGFVFTSDLGHKLICKSSSGDFIRDHEWQYMTHRIVEEQRGMDPDSDLFSPGYFSLFIDGNDQVELFATIVSKKDQPLYDFNIKSQQYDARIIDNTRPGWSIKEAMEKALNSYVVKRGDFKSIIAGYPWFLDWGRDSMIFVRGLIAAQKIDEAKDVLKQFARFEEKGTFPNMIHGDDAGNRDTSDAPLWFAKACSDLVSQVKNNDFFNELCGDRTILRVLFSIGTSFIAGTSNGIYMDHESCLIFSPAHFTWMDTNFPACTPRQGYAIEIQALWYATVSLLAKIEPRGIGNDWESIANKIKESIIKLFWLEDKGYLADCLHADPGQSARNAQPDDALRPNQLLAITMNAVTDNDICRLLLDSCMELLLPGAIRSLGDRDLVFPIKIIHNNQVINTPSHPYQGRYEGDEDIKRKPAYHNGTGWTWLFPNFCEAWVKVYGKESVETALSWLASSTILINQGCVGHMPEIVDGDFPHYQRGCDAQAWGTSELLRVWTKLSRY